MQTENQAFQKHVYSSSQNFHAQSQYSVIVLLAIQCFIQSNYDVRIDGDYKHDLN